jgi:hypothetical protein
LTFKFHFNFVAIAENGIASDSTKTNDSANITFVFSTKHVGGAAKNFCDFGDFFSIFVTVFTDVALVTRIFFDKSCGFIQGFAIMISLCYGLL